MEEEQSNMLPKTLWRNWGTLVFQQYYVVLIRFSSFSLSNKKETKKKKKRKKKEKKKKKKGKKKRNEK